MSGASYHQFTQKLWVFRRIERPDGAGGRVTVWAYSHTIRAKVSQPRANQRVEADQAGAEHDHIVHTAARTDVRRGDRLRHPVAGVDPVAVDAESRPYFTVEATVVPSTAIYKRARCVLIESEG